MQDTLVTQRIENRITDTLILTEHDPVFTIGQRASAENNLLWPPSRLRAEGIEVIRTNRGGDITYHGPGQLVGYPIVSLAPRQDLHAYLRLLEQVLLDTLDNLGLAAARRPGKTGIWIGPRKIAAIGVAVRRWIAYHGFALNINVNLRHFAGIIPCGIAANDGTVTSLQSELGHPVAPDKVKHTLHTEFWRHWPRWRDHTDAPPTTPPPTPPHSLAT
jgi:lipoyl(octanoyl) transferase